MRSGITHAGPSVIQINMYSMFSARFRLCICLFGTKPVLACLFFFFPFPLVIAGIPVFKFGAQYKDGNEPVGFSGCKQYNATQRNERVCESGTLEHWTPFFNSSVGGHLRRYEYISLGRYPGRRAGEGEESQVWDSELH